MTEAELQATIIEYLIWHGYLVLRINGGGMVVDGRYIKFYYWQTLGRDQQNAGVSDVLTVTPWGQVMVVECKAEGKSPTLEQIDFMQAVKERGGLVYCANNLNDFLTWIEAQNCNTVSRRSVGGDGD